MSRLLFIDSWGGYPLWSHILHGVVVVSALVILMVGMVRCFVEVGQGVFTLFKYSPRLLKSVVTACSILGLMLVFVVSLIVGRFVWWTDEAKFSLATFQLERWKQIHLNISTHPMRSGWIWSYTYQHGVKKLSLSTAFTPIAKEAVLFPDPRMVQSLEMDWAGDVAGVYCGRECRCRFYDTYLEICTMDMTEDSRLQISRLFCEFFHNGKTYQKSEFWNQWHKVMRRISDIINKDSISCQTQNTEACRQRCRMIIDSVL